MDVSDGSKSDLQYLASQSLIAFKSISDTAKNNLSQASGLNPSSLAFHNSFTGQTTRATMDELNRQMREARTNLVRQPAIARVVMIDENDRKQTYFICSGTPEGGPIGEAQLASYNSPIGRFASQPIGFGLEIGGRYLETIETATFLAECHDEQWDARDTTVRSSEFGQVIIASLRSLVESGEIDLDTADEIERILAEEGISDLLKSTKSRRIIDKMGLRSQPLLDQFQDDIFRLPIDSMLAILGAPGTGKTTTLIRRLGQKTQTGYLDDQENRLVANSVAGAAEHARSWLVFTPTELLKQFVKTAFDKNEIAASTERLKTWDEHRRHLARNVFGFLTNTRGSGLTMPEPEYAQTITDAAVTDPIGWFSDFDTWQSAVFWSELQDSADRLSACKMPDAAALGLRLKSILAKSKSATLASRLLLLSEIAPASRSVDDAIKVETDKRIRRALTIQNNSDKRFLDDLATFLDSLGTLADPDEVEDDDEDETEAPERKTGKPRAIAAYERTLRAHARVRARGRRAGSGRTARIIVWLGDRGLEDAESIEIGKSLQIRSDIRRFVAPSRTYINRMAQRYRQFRRERRSETRWYAGAANEAHPLEVDLILLAVLQPIHAMLGDVSIARALDEPAFASLRTWASIFLNQIVIDEATDFSPIQLRCMASLADPKIDSVFVCGDYNQRLTRWGSKTDNDLIWAIEGVELRAVTVAYRQTRQLHELATRLLIETDGNTVTASLPPDVDNEGLDPVLGTSLADSGVLAGWLAERICEIERFGGTNELPSTAVFVNGEDQVKPIADALNVALSPFSIRAAACYEGRMIGEASEVRVFDVQHIKGLEFEAVFFVGIDELAQDQPDIFDKYLYVGTTRAATYLGLTCAGESLPAPINALADLFKPNWQ